METNELFTSLMTAYMAQMDSAIKIAETISDHGKEEKDELVETLGVLRQAGMAYESLLEQQQV